MFTYTQLHNCVRTALKMCDLKQHKRMDKECKTNESIVKYTRGTAMLWFIRPSVVRHWLLVSIHISVCLSVCVCVRSRLFHIFHIFIYDNLRDVCARSHSASEFHAYQKSLCDRFHSTMGILFHFPNIFIVIRRLLGFLWFIVIIYIFYYCCCVFLYYYFVVEHS